MFLTSLFIEINLNILMDLFSVSPKNFALYKYFYTVTFSKIEKRLRKFRRNFRKIIKGFVKIAKKLY